MDSAAAFVQAPSLGSHEWHHAVDTRDASYDGVFFVAIVYTRIYCRPVCPSRLARPEHRRFFLSRADAEAAGFRACRRCCPDRAPVNSPLDAVPRLAESAAARILAGDLNGRSVRDLARDLGMSERHMRRALARALGASPFRLALEQRLLNATRLLRDTRAPVTRIAYASGIQSLRRFNAAFREQFQMSPTQWRQQATRE